MCRRWGWLGCDAWGAGSTPRAGCAAEQSHQHHAERLPRAPDPQPQRSRGRTVFTAEVRQTAKQGSNFALLLLKSFSLRFLCPPVGEGDVGRRGAAGWVLALPLGLGPRAAKHQAGTAAAGASPCTSREQAASHPHASRNKSPPPTSPPRIGLGTHLADTHEHCLSPQVWQQAWLHAPLPLAASLSCEAPQQRPPWQHRLCPPTDWFAVSCHQFPVPGAKSLPAHRCRAVSKPLPTALRAGWEPPPRRLWELTAGPTAWPCPGSAWPHLRTKPAESVRTTRDLLTQHHLCTASCGYPVPKTEGFKSSFFALVSATERLRPQQKFWCRLTAEGRRGNVSHRNEISWETINIQESTYKQ